MNAIEIAADLSLVSGVFAGIAAVLWWTSTFVALPYRNLDVRKNGNGKNQSNRDASLRGSTINPLATGVRQACWNRWASAAAAVAATSQCAAYFVHH